MESDYRCNCSTDFQDLGDLRRSVADDVANYPNSFQGVNVDTFPRANSQQLALVDGGENGENVPLAPLLVKARGVDAIVAFDSSADTSENWPNGTAIITVRMAPSHQLSTVLIRSAARQTYNRTKIFESGTTSFPPVPLDPATWVSLGLNTRPTFFGCNSTAANAPGNLSYPLVVYIPNAPPSGLTKLDTSILNPFRPYLTKCVLFWDCLAPGRGTKI
jgi:lysophospholipase